jgi:hypothetical protein
MTHGGTAYRLPPAVQRIHDSASSSSASLPTPRSTRGGSSTETFALLATPTAQDGKNSGGPSQFDRNTLLLNAQVLRLG